MDYNAPMSMIFPGVSVYGHGVNPQVMLVYQQGIYSGRNDNQPTGVIRSQLLEDFRENRDRQWELRVGE